MGRPISPVLTLHQAELSNKNQKRTGRKKLPSAGMVASIITSIGYYHFFLTPITTVSHSGVLQPFCLIEIRQLSKHITILTERLLISSEY